IGSILFSHDGTLLFGCVGNDTVCVWETDSIEHRILININPALAGVLSLSPDGKLLVTTDVEGSIKLWQVPTGKAVQQLDKAQGGPLCALAFSPDGKTLASANGSGTLRLWDLSTGKETVLPGLRFTTGFTMLSADGKEVLQADGPNLLRWSVRT